MTVKRTELKEWKLEYAPALAASLSNPKILANLRDGLPYPYTEEEAQKFILSMQAANHNNSFFFAISADEQIIGNISVTRMTNIHSRTAELGYYIAEEYWGQGIMTAAVKQMCTHVFENSDIIRIFAEPFAYNIGSCRVLEKAGFTLEGTLRSNAVKNGTVLDMKMYSLLRTDF